MQHAAPVTAQRHPWPANHCCHGPHQLSPDAVAGSISGPSKQAAVVGWRRQPCLSAWALLPGLLSRPSSIHQRYKRRLSLARSAVCPRGRRPGLGREAQAGLLTVLSPFCWPGLRAEAAEDLSSVLPMYWMFKNRG